MPIRFAAARSQGRANLLMPGGAALMLRTIARAANDNPQGDWPRTGAKAASGASGGSGAAPPEHLLQAALRHFAEHGLGAARAAREQAERAFFAGDRRAYDWWLDITRTLDRRLASEAERATQDHEAARDSGD